MDEFHLRLNGPLLDMLSELPMRDRFEELGRNVRGHGGSYPSGHPSGHQLIGHVQAKRCMPGFRFLHVDEVSAELECIQLVNLRIARPGPELPPVREEEVVERAAGERWGGEGHGVHLRVVDEFQFCSVSPFVERFFPSETL